MFLLYDVVFSLINQSLLYVRNSGHTIVGNITKKYGWKSLPFFLHAHLMFVRKTSNIPDGTYLKHYR